jgi:hypothetical protein
MHFLRLNFAVWLFVVTHLTWRFAKLALPLTSSINYQAVDDMIVTSAIVYQFYSLSSSLSFGNQQQTSSSYRYPRDLAVHSLTSTIRQGTVNFPSLVQPSLVDRAATDESIYCSATCATECPREHILAICYFDYEMILFGECASWGDSVELFGE